MTASRLLQIIYVSTASAEPTRAELLTLLEGSRRRNAKRAITGVILYHDRQYLQVLEGPETTVSELFDRIRGDHRHVAVNLLWHGFTETREFPDSAMSFRELSEPLPPAEIGFSDIQTARIFPVGADATPAKHFIRVFRRVSGIDRFSAADG